MEPDLVALWERRLANGGPPLSNCPCSHLQGIVAVASPENVLSLPPESTEVAA